MLCSVHPCCPPLHPLSIIPKFFLNLPILCCVSCFSVPFPPLELSLPSSPTSTKQQSWAILHPLLIQEFFLVPSLPVVHCFPMLHTIHINTLPNISTTLYLSRTMYNTILILKLNSFSRGSKQRSRSS